MVDRVDRIAGRTGDAAQAWVQVLEDGLLWLRAYPSCARRGSAGASSLDQQMADLHARYERACIED